MNNAAKTPLQELNLTDRFLFAETIDEPEAYEAMVGILLENEIELLERTQTEKELRVSSELRAVRIFINTHGKNRGNFSQEFLDFMEYINDTRDAVVARSESLRLKLIHSKVEKIRHSEKCGVKYMQRWEEIAYARQDGHVAGYAEARREGILRDITAVCKKLCKGKMRNRLQTNLSRSRKRLYRYVV